MTSFVSLDELNPGGQSALYPSWLTDMYEVKEFIGRAGKLQSDQIRVGIVTLKHDADYPSHSHPAPEIYIQISGKVKWKVGDVTRLISSITAINIPSGTPHAMCNMGNTEAQLIYFWYAPDNDKSLLEEDAQLD